MKVEMEMLEGLIIEIEPSFEPGERFVLVPVKGESSGPVTYLLKDEGIVGERSDERTAGQVHLSQIQSETISALCLNITIPLIPNDPLGGLDGTTARITIVQGNNKVRLEWWQEVPTPWKPVESIIGMLRQIMNDARTSR